MTVMSEPVLPSVVGTGAHAPLGGCRAATSPESQRVGPGLRVQGGLSTDVSALDPAAYAVSTDYTGDGERSGTAERTPAAMGQRMPSATAIGLAGGGEACT